jgi:hypothetical protein
MHANHSRLGSVLGFGFAALLAAAGTAGCDAGEDADGDVSSATLAIVTVPSDVRCIRVTAQGNRTLTRTFSATPGSSASMTVNNIPVGSVLFSADAFSSDCANVGSSTVPTWTSEPVTVQISAGAVASVPLIMRRPARASISVDFQDCITGPRSWDFETGTAEGWAFDTTLPGSADAHVGTPTASTALPQSGARSLALGFSGVGVSGAHMVFVKVPLCANASGLNLAGRRFQAYVRLVTASGSAPLNNGQGHYVALFVGPTDHIPGGDFSVNPATGGGDTPGSWYFVDTELSDGFGNPTTPITHIGFRFLTNGPWTGTVYLDAIRLL